ncbi:hypothetical protein ACIGFK_01780 [Streptomyces sp. NPDC085524]|uniref:hypothetical protein n=1 Tax=unclassified Streptomyces TaxID=2593676 RepID=UPI0035DFCB78
MTTTSEPCEILLRIDPARNWYASLTRAAEEARRRGLGLRIVMAAPSVEETPHAEDARGGATTSVAETDTLQERSRSARETERTAR